MSNQGMGSALDTIASLAGRATGAGQQLSQLAQSAPQIQQQVGEAVDVAETWAIASIVLQAVAAFSAFGMLMLHQKMYNKKYHSGTSSNPRKRRRKRR
jgi:hypothetical protein